MNTDARRPLARAAGKAAALLLALVVALALATVQAPATAVALETASSDTVVNSYTWGTVTWTLYDDGELVLSPADGDEGTLGSYSNSTGLPWYTYRKDITSVTFTGTIHAGESAVALFSGLSSLESIDLSGFDTSGVTDMSEMFSYCSSLTTLDLSGLDTSSVKDMSSMFSGCSSLTSLDLSGLDTSSVTDMNTMFSDCSSLTSLDLSGFDTSSVTDMNSMFKGCSSLTSIDLSGVDTSGVTDLQRMFYECTSLESLDLSGFNTSNATTMRQMFYYCSSLAALDLSSFDTSNVTSMIDMFYYCSSLAALDLSSFDTSNVTDMESMFAYCKALTSLDLSSFDTANVSTFGWMFYHCTNLVTIYASSDWSGTGFVSSEGMFTGCTSLVGGNGTAYSSSHTTISYARIDTDDTPGYFTYRAAGSSDAAAATVTRLAGDNRYETMAAIVEAAYAGETCDVAVLATGANFADALAAASLAGALDAPIVLVKPGDPSAAIEVLQELGCGYAYVIGGTSAVSEADVAAIEEACGIGTERISGENRRETALAVAQAANAQMGASARSSVAIVATGAEFADALSASPYSYWAAAPIYLTRTDGTIDQDALDAIEEAGYETVVIMGGTSAVTAASEAAIRALGVEVVRLEGENRYDTCAAMAAWSVEQGMSYDGAAVATGAAFPDALAGATLCGRTGSVILLARDGRTQAVDLLADASGVGGVYVLGGESAVSASLCSYLEEVLG